MPQLAPAQSNMLQLALAQLHISSCLGALALASCTFSPARGSIFALTCTSEFSPVTPRNAGDPAVFYVSINAGPNSSRAFFFSAVCGYNFPCFCGDFCETIVSEVERFTFGYGLMENARCEEKKWIQIRAFVQRNDKMVRRERSVQAEIWLLVSCGGRNLHRSTGFLLLNWFFGTCVQFPRFNLLLLPTFADIAQVHSNGPLCFASSAQNKSRSRFDTRKSFVMSQMSGHITNTQCMFF